MNRFLAAGLAIVGIQACLAPSPVQAQRPNPRLAADPNFRLPVSPYLNLLRRGQSPGLNYYNLVLPEMTFQRNISELQTQVTRNQGSITQLEQQTTAILPDTGHPVQFMSHNRYFLNSGGQGGAGRGGSPASIRTPTPGGTARAPLAPPGARR